MLEHLCKSPSTPNRVVVMGGSGFVGAAIAKRLAAAGLGVVPLSSADIDLLATDAVDRLAEHLAGADRLVIVSADVPCKDRGALLGNITMIDRVCGALDAAPVEHVVYISSDAVYAGGSGPLTESSCAAPESLHGVMHLARERILEASVDAPLAVLRPSLLYGAADPHNGYGPNRFRRSAAETGSITLFGGGEERRDHVCIDDVAEIALRVVIHRSTGVLNIASGTSHSFMAVAEEVARSFDRQIEIVTTPRQSPATHVHFDVTACIRAFPDFGYTSLADGLARAHAAELDAG